MAAAHLTARTLSNTYLGGSCPISPIPWSMSTTLNSALAERTVGDLVTEDFRRGAIFKRFGIDFCCGGGIPLTQACDRQGADIDEVVAALEELQQSALAPQHQWFDRWEPRHLVDHIVNHHHAYVRQAIPTLRAFTQKVARVHGDSRPELVQVARTFEELAREMASHMAAEEEVLFPMIKLGVDKSGELRPLTEVIDDLEGEHDAAGGLMAEIRRLTSDFQPPDWACNTYRAAFVLLEEFESDLHTHVHLENNVLFPKVLAKSAAA